MAALAKIDEQTAQAFYARREAASTVSKYVDELDAELRQCMVKTALYCLYREGGMDSVFANMNACRRAPGAANVDRHFSEKARYRMGRMSQRNLDQIVNIAKKAGVQTAGKFYVGGLGRYTDQSAWCSHADDVLETARAKNLTVRGAINHEGVSMPPPKPRLMAPDIMQEKIQRLLAAEPQTAEKVKKNPKKMQEVKERVIDKHVPKWIKKRATE